MKRNFYSYGFTLLEVMIALSIFAIVAVVSLRVCLLSTGHIQTVNERKNLILLADAKAEEYKAGILDIEAESSGMFQFPFENYEWEATLTDITIADTEYGITFTPYRITVRKDGSEYSIITGLFKISEENKKDEKE